MRRFLFAFFILSFAYSASAQDACNPNEHITNCITNLKKDFTFLKAYKVDGDESSSEPIEYSYVFTKGTQYMINLCGEGEGTDGLVVNLFDSRKTQVASSVVDGQYIEGLIFPCNATGIYYLSFTFENSKNHCSGAVLGFKRG